MRRIRKIFLLALVVLLNACDSGETPSPAQSQPLNARSAACSAYVEFQAFASGMSSSTLSDQQIVDRLAGYQDELQADGLALHRANYATDGDTLLMISRLIGEIRAAVDSFGVRSGEVLHAMRNLSVASDAVLCPRSAASAATSSPSPTPLDPVETRDDLASIVEAELAKRLRYDVPTDVDYVTLDMYGDVLVVQIYDLKRPDLHEAWDSVAIAIEAREPDLLGNGWRYVGWDDNPASVFSHAFVASVENWSDYARGDLAGPDFRSGVNLEAYN
jgi:hypothetical protein